MFKVIDDFVGLVGKFETEEAAIQFALSADILEDVSVVDPSGNRVNVFNAFVPDEW